MIPNDIFKEEEEPEMWEVAFDEDFVSSGAITNPEQTGQYERWIRRPDVYTIKNFIRKVVAHERSKK